MDLISIKSMGEIMHTLLQNSYIRTIKGNRIFSELTAECGAIKNIVVLRAVSI